MGSKRKADLKFLDFIASEFSGNNVYVFESYVQNGKRVYKDANGIVKDAPNGRYMANGDIYIDLNAGMEGEGFVLNTFAHELTHHIRDWSPTKFKVLADFLVKEYGKAGQSVDELVHARMARSNLNYDTAFAEVVADSMEKMFADGNIMDKLTKLKAQDKGLLQRIKRFIDKWLSKIKEFYSAEGQYVTREGELAHQLEKLEQLQQLFAEALVDAGENFQTAEKSTTVEGGVRYSFSGIHSNSTDVQKLSVAEEMLKNGSDSETIRKETGWFQGYDGKWRYEINDSEMEVLKNLSSPLYARYVDGEALRLDEVIKHDGLFAAYPELRNMSVEVKRTLGKNVAGSYNADADTLRLSGSMYLTADMLKKVFIHEIQHKIQNIEGFARGSSPNYWETRGIGEAEYARFVAQSEAERAKILARLTDDERRDYLRYRETDNQIQKYAEALLDGRNYEYRDKAEGIDDIEAENDALYRKMYSEEWFSRLNEIDNILADGVSEKLNTVFYKNTAGEIEARDVASRIDYTDEQRRNIRPDIDRANVTFAKQGENLVYIGDTKDGRRCYQSGFDSSVSMEDRIEAFKKRIATVFNLGAVELKTDVKRIRILGDKFTSQKNLFGDKVGETGEYEAKISALYDLADILATAKYDPTATNKEPSYVNLNIKPKNAAHKGVKYWYKFKNEIVFDGVPYTVTFNIRDKGVNQYQYLIDFHENKTPGLSNTAVKNLLRADQASYKDSIRNPGGIVNTNSNRNSDRTGESISNRSLLANAFESMAQNDIERQKIAEYKSKIETKEAEERKLRDLKEQIKEMSFAKGPRDTAKLRSLREEAIKTANRLSIYDGQLLRLEASKPLQNVLLREKKKAYDRAKAEGKQAKLAAVEGRNKTAMRHKIPTVVGGLQQDILTTK